MPRKGALTHVHTGSQNLYACYRSQRVHCGAPTGVGDRVRVRAPEARLGYRMGRRGWAQAPPTPAGAACAARPRSSCFRQVICFGRARARRTSPPRARAAACGVCRTCAGSHASGRTWCGPSRSCPPSAEQVHRKKNHFGPSLWFGGLHRGHTSVIFCSTATRFCGDPVQIVQW